MSPMSALLLMILLAQTVPFRVQQNGVMVGVVRLAGGQPAPHVRVGALARPDSIADLAAGTVMASVAETDDHGRYRLENIPPGEYYVVAGRVDLPTYYPGVSEVSSGTVIRIAAGEVRVGVDFALKETSARPLYMHFDNALATVGANIRVVGADGKFPVSSSAGPVTLEFTRTLDGFVTEVPVTAATIRLQLLVSPPAAEFRIRVRNLPPGFTVKSIARGPVNLTNETLKIVPEATPQTMLSTFNVPGIATPDGIRVPSSLLGGSGAVIVPSPAVLVLSLMSARLAEDLTFTIEKVALPSATGVRVSGMGRRSDTHPVFMSGRQGIAFSDGSFEFRDAAPGRYAIATVDSPGRAMGAAIVVGNRDIENVELEDVAMTPPDIQELRTPDPNEGLTPGTKLPLRTIRGRVLDEATGQPVPSGKVSISNTRSPIHFLDEDGRFEIPNLLPGAYDLDIQVFGHAELRHPIRVDLADIFLDLTTQLIRK